MSRVKMVCALMVCVLAMPAAAGAQEGNGPYAPFPSAPENGTGDAWYARMNADIPPAQLVDGAFAGELRPVAASEPDGRASARAGVGVGGIGAGALVAAFALGALGAAVAVWSRRGART